MIYCSIKFLTLIHHYSTSLMKMRRLSFFKGTLTHININIDSVSLSPLSLSLHLSFSSSLPLPFSLSFHLSFSSSLPLPFSAKTQCENSKKIFQEKEFRSHRFRFPDSCVCERFIYSHDRSAYSAAGKYVERSWEYIYKSPTHECGNWDWGRASPRKGVRKWDFRCSVLFSSLHPLPPSPSPLCETLLLELRSGEEPICLSGLDGACLLNKISTQCWNF